jgi:hypothetical protein
MNWSKLLEDALESDHKPDDDLVLWGLERTSTGAMDE